jgi:hypothetical protein
MDPIVSLRAGSVPTTAEQFREGSAHVTKSPLETSRFLGVSPETTRQTAVAVSQLTHG